MELKDYIRVIRKRWLIIVAAMLVVVAGAALATALSPKIYEAQTRLFVSTSGGSDSGALLCRAATSPSSASSPTRTSSRPPRSLTQ